MNDMVWCIDEVVVMDEVNLMVDNDTEEVYSVFERRVEGDELNIDDAL